MEVGDDSLALKQFSTEHEDGVEMMHKGCRVSLERRRVEPELLFFRVSRVPFGLGRGFPSVCQFLSLEDRVVLLGAMIEMFLPNSDDRSMIHSLGVGSLAHTFPEVAQRLAKTVGKHPDWPGVRKRNRISPGAAEWFVSQIGDEAKVFPELEAALLPVGYRPHFAQMEKVLIRPAKKLSYHEWLSEQGVDPDIEVPFDAMTFFYLEALSPISEERSGSEDK
jgi:hypothetical protein